MTISIFALVGWGLFLVAVGIIIGIVGTTYYFKRFRKRALELIETYKDRAKRAEHIIRGKAEKPGPIERG